MERLDELSWGQHGAVTEYASSMVWDLFCYFMLYTDPPQVPQPFTQDPLTTTYNLHLPGPHLNLNSSTNPPHPHSSPNLPHAYPKPKAHKQCLYDIDRKAICEYYLAHPKEKQEVIARRFSVERSTISKILKHKKKWLNIMPSGTNGVDLARKGAKHRPFKFPVVESEMHKWIIDVTEEWYTHLPNYSITSSSLQSDSYGAQNPNQHHHGPLSDTSLCNKARAIARSHGITAEQFKASSGWVDSFKNRHGIRNGHWWGYQQNVHDGNATAASSMDVHVPTPTEYQQLPISFPNAQRDFQDEPPMESSMANRSEDEEEESNSEDEDGNDEADMGSLVHQRLSALPHLPDSSFPHQIPSWPMAPSLTRISNESHPSSHRGRSYQHGHNSQRSESPAIPPLTPSIGSPQHYQSASALSAKSLDVSAPGSPFPFTHSSQHPSGYYDQHSHMQTQSKLDLHISQVFGAKNMVEELDLQHSHKPHKEAPAYAALHQADLPPLSTSDSLSPALPTTEVFPPPPPISDTSMPTLTECEDFLTKISLFVNKGYGQDILTPRKREWLRKLKVAFFEAGSGIPITLDSDEER